MTRKRADSFKIALDTLREELRAGVHRAGSRLTANDIAERLSLSQTPVREALSRLAGEGLLLDRRGQGFFVQSLAEQDLIALFRLELELLLIAGDERSSLPLSTSTGSSPGPRRHRRTRPSSLPVSGCSGSSRRLQARRWRAILVDCRISSRRCAPPSPASCTACRRSSVSSWTSCRAARRRRSAVRSTPSSPGASASRRA